MGYIIVYRPIEGHLGYFQGLASMNNELAFYKTQMWSKVP